MNIASSNKLVESVLLEIMIDEQIKQHRINELRKAIDEALDRKFEYLFRVLTDELKELMEYES